MEESSSEMSAEEMTEAMSLEEKPQSSVLNSDDTSGSENSTGKSLQDRSGGDGRFESPDQADSAENTDEAENSEQPEEENSCQFTDKDPIDLVQYIEKYMMVMLEKSYSYVGFIHSIDPITYSIILSVPKKDGTYQTVIIPGTSVLDIKEVPCDSSIIPPKRKLTHELPKDDLQITKKKVLAWLKDNHIPVTEEEEKIVFGGITLLPPYGEKDICTTNSLIAIEIRNLIARMPADYQPK